jgi:hypothetical protein
MSTLLDAAITELAIITTKNNEGQHFTKWSQHWAELESEGLIAIHRPVHDQTGLPYRDEFWTLEVTESGVAMVEANPHLQPTPTNY